MEKNKEPFINSSSKIINLNNQDLTKSKGFVKQEKIKYFDKKEIRERINKIEKPEHRILFEFLWRTGCRVSEIINIRKRDLDFDNNIINIRWLKRRKFLYRKIPLHSSLKNILFMFVDHLKADDKLFDYSRQWIYMLCDKYGLGHPHKLRHSFAVNFLRESNDPASLVILKQILGHSNVSTTMIYLEIVPIHQAKALERVSFD